MTAAIKQRGNRRCVVYEVCLRGAIAGDRPVTRLLSSDKLRDSTQAGEVGFVCCGCKKMAEASREEMSLHFS